MTHFDDAFEDLPLVAILRGVTPDNAGAVGDALVDAGFRLIEVPLNSPDPLASIATLAERYGEAVIVGAGTVLSPDAARDVVVHGGRLVVMPHGDPAVIDAARKAGAWCIPGAATPTEAFAAFAAGADAVKLFPGEALPPPVLKSWRSVFPPELRLLPVGGVGLDNMAKYVAAGASGFGIGSALFKPGKRVEKVAEDARAFVHAWREIAG